MAVPLLGILYRVQSPAEDEPETITFDLVLRPKLGIRLVAPLVTVMFVWYAATDSAWSFKLGAVGAAAVCAVAWYGRIVILEPTVMWRSFPNRWKAVDLSNLAKVHSYWSGREPHLVLDVVDKSDASFSIERWFWHHDWRLLFAYVAKWSERARAEDSTFQINEKTEQRVHKFRHLVR
jgi:hypothetical protein